MIDTNMEMGSMKNNDRKIIIGITGTLGAGKGTIVEYLEQRGF